MVYGLKPKYLNTRYESPFVMLSRSSRLPSLDITRVMKHGTRITGNGIICIYEKKTDSRLPASLVGGRGNDKKATDNETNVSRFAFIVSTKIDKRAVYRNRIRRVMSESVRLLLPTMSKSIDCVFIARRELVGLSQKEVEKRIIEVMKLSGVC
jgi:ribonuclease P protein component